MGDCFSAEGSDSPEAANRSSVELVQTEKMTLLQNAQKVGPVWRRGVTLKTWTKYQAVLAGG